MARAKLNVTTRRRDDGLIELLAPAPGIWRDAPREGSLIRPGFSLGSLQILGVLHELVADAAGVVEEQERPLARQVVEHGQTLLVLDPQAGVGALADEAKEDAQSTSGLVFASPMSGRYYGRPSPEKPPFVLPGDTVEPGQTLCLLEVMKTFNRVGYGGESLPKRARIKAILPQDGDDLSAGQPILELEALE